jgi:hypothetical protein
MLIEIKLSQSRHGAVKMWLDGKQLLEKDKIVTLPKDRINVGWRTKGYYDRIQVGITAKNGTQDLVLYADDVEVRTK